MVNVTYKGNSYEVEDHTKVKDFLASQNVDLNGVLACKVFNEVKSLDFELFKDCNIELIDYTSSDGNRIYIRGITFILLMAFEELYPEIKMTVNYSLGHSIYCEPHDREKLTQEMIDKLVARMKEIVEADMPFEKKIFNIEEAKALYKEKNREDRVGLLDSRMKSYVSMYYCGDYWNYFYGVMPISTKYLKYFDVKLYENGLLLVYPRRSNPTQVEEIINTKKLYATFDEYDKLHRILGVENVAGLNKCIQEGKIGELIRVSEALHEKKIAQIADNIAADRRKKIILIAGPSSSGKTTFAQRLGVQLKTNGIKGVTLSMDNYFVNREDNPRDEDGNYDFECLEAIDVKLFNEQLTALLNGEEVELPTFDFTTGTRKFLGNKAKLHDDEVLVIEGIHGLNEKLTASIPRQFKYKIYISALTALNIDDYNRISTTDSRLLRRILRDSKYRSHPADATIRMWPSVRRGEEKYIFPYQEEADVIFNSSLVYEISALKSYVEPLLVSVPHDAPEFSEAKRLYEFLGYFLPIETDDIPLNSLLREFVGGGCFYR
ncbi:MAG: nucleoside kinase [Clostridia bacterium]|nr:nucleoside kinase [Clostridia bacterium]